MMKLKQVEFVKYAIEEKKIKGEELGLIFDKQGFLTKIENVGTFSGKDILNVGDKLVSISSEERTYFANLFCMSRNNQKWAKFVSGNLHIEMIRISNNKRKCGDEESEIHAKRVKTCG